MKPTHGSGKSQITKGGQTSSSRFAADPHQKIKGGEKPATEQAIKTKKL